MLDKPKDEYLSFEEAREYIRSLNFKTNKEYKDWWRKIKPNNLPSNLEQKYRRN